MESNDKDKSLTFAISVAKAIADLGGRAFFVGGYVRDKLLGMENLDIDIEVYGLGKEDLKKLLQTFGTVSDKGEEYGIFSLMEYGIDFALPRREKATGKGHKDFLVSPDPDLSFREAAIRRDFTINAMMEDILSGEIVDPFGGRADLDKKLLRHMDSERFVEDPLRALRACQFAARFGFTMAEETKVLCKAMDLTLLTAERVREEMLKGLLKSKKPSDFFVFTYQYTNDRFWFKELYDLMGILQDKEFHPEGDAFKHTMDVLDQAASLKKQAENPAGFMLAALCHDFGKAITTEFIKGRIHAYQHESKGLPLVEVFLKRLAFDKHTCDYVLNLTMLHMKPNAMAAKNSSLKSMNHMFYDAVSPVDLLLLAKADAIGRGDACMREEYERDTEGILLAAYEDYKEILKRPFVSGKDLIKAGAKPGPAFKEVLTYVTKLRLAGVDYDTQLRQAMGQYRKAVKTESN